MSLSTWTTRGVLARGAFAGLTLVVLAFCTTLLVR